MCFLFDYGVSGLMFGGLDDVCCGVSGVGVVYCCLGGGGLSGYCGIDCGGVLVV